MTIGLHDLSATQRRALARLHAVFSRHSAVLYVVGGAVRDLALGEAPGDIDLATDATPETVRQAAREAGASAVYASNERFATVGLRLEAERFEVTTFRGPAASSRDPLASLYADLALRDFTINAMALALDQPATLIDPHDGYGDLVRRMVRGVGNPHERLVEDPLRALRAVRFAAQFDCTIEPDTRAAVATHAATLATVSPERVGAELTRLLLTPGVAGGLHLGDQLGLLNVVLPELRPLLTFSAAGSKDLWLHTRRVISRTPARAAVRWAALLHDSAKPQTYSVQDGEAHFFGHEAAGARLARRVLTRLRLDNDLVTAVSKLVELHGRPAHYDTDWTDGAVRRLMLDIDGRLDDLFDLARADVTSARPQMQQRAQARIDALAAHCLRLNAAAVLARLQSPLDGNQLMALFQRPPGPWLRPLKEHLRGLVIDGVLAPDDAAGAIVEAERWMHEQAVVTTGGSTPR